jgi:hypothetical protein
MTANATVYRKADEAWATVCLDKFVDAMDCGEPDIEFTFKDFAAAMRCAVRAGGTITLVVEP